MLTLQIAKNWHVSATPVYRYSEPEWVDEFFATGRLRLSPLVSHKQHEDSERGDKSEGFSARYIVGENDGPTLIAGVNIAQNALSFCTSLVLSDDLKKSFGSSVIKIKDPRNFGIEIANNLAGFVEGLEGPCLYEERKSKLSIPGLSLDDLRVSPGSNNLDMQKFFQMVESAGGAEEYFRKPVSYQNQAEYRLVWLMRKVCDSHVFVECPELIRFCERI